MVRSNIVQSVERLGAFIHYIGAQFVERFSTWKEDAYNSCHLSCPYMLTHYYSFRSTSVKVQYHTSYGECEWGAAEVSLPRSTLPKAWSPPTMSSCGRSKRLIYSLLFTVFWFYVLVH